MSWSQDISREYFSVIPSYKLGNQTTNDWIKYVINMAILWTLIYNIGGYGNKKLKQEALRGRANC